MLDYDMIAYRIWDRRKNVKKITQRKMAEDLGMYQGDISDIEHNKPSCGIRDLSKLEVIADYLNMSLQYLLFGDEKDEVLDND